jgi:heat shock protein HspQ
MIENINAKFSLGELVNHNLFGYRGVIFDLDHKFLGSLEWYEKVAKSKPPKDQPWYHVLVDGSDIQTYVAERNLSIDKSKYPISHPRTDDYFSSLGTDGYILRKQEH